MFPFCRRKMGINCVEAGLPHGKRTESAQERMPEVPGTGTVGMVPEAERGGGRRLNGMLPEVGNRAGRCRRKQTRMQAVVRSGPVRRDWKCRIVNGNSCFPVPGNLSAGSFPLP